MEWMDNQEFYKQISWVIYNHLKIYGKEKVNYIQNYHS